MHVLIFIAGHAMLLCLILFERTIFNFLVSNIDCFKTINQKFQKMEAISDDYYSVMDLRFLISEYERAKQERKRYQQLIEDEKHSADFVIKAQALNRHVRRLKDKARTIRLHVEGLCREVGVKAETFGQKLHQLQINIEKILANQKHKNKSKVQTYDIRDCEEYFGVLELEALLKKCKEDPELNLGYEEIQRQTSRKYVPGASLRDSKKRQIFSDDEDVPSSFVSSDLEDLPDKGKGEVSER